MLKPVSPVIVEIMNTLSATARRKDKVLKPISPVIVERIHC